MYKDRPKRLQYVTITGADDSTNIGEMIDMSAEFPFVEWAILVSRAQRGGPRFPDEGWTEKFVSAAHVNSMKVSMHLCGGWVRELLTGTLNLSELPQDLLGFTKRIQINTHAEQHVSTIAMFDKMSEIDQIDSKDFIFQWDDVNNHLAFASLSYSQDPSILFDLSHGAGVLPSKWPSPVDGFPCGYAGGLGPENIVEQLNKIHYVTDTRTYWVDMEGRVRTEDGLNLDMDKVRSVLQQVKDWMAE